MNNQSFVDKWNTVKNGFTGAVNCVKGWYTNYKNTDYIQVRRKCNAEVTLCTKNAPDTPIHTVTQNGDIRISLVDLGLLMAGGAAVCAVMKCIRCKL